MTWNWKTPSQWQRLLLGLLFVAAASVFRAMFFGGLGRGIPYLLFFPAVTLAALYGGLSAGLLATALSSALTFFWVLRRELSPVEYMALAIFAISCTLISFICEMMLRANAKARLADAALRETNEYLDNLLNYANAPIIVWDPQFKITRFNHAFEALTGRAAGEVVGKSLELLFPPALVENSMALIKQTTGGERWETIEIAILHLDGSIRIVLWNSATVFAANGKTPVATIAQGQDITERKRAEEALHQSEARFRKVFEMAPLPLCHVTKDGVIDFRNERFVQVFGYTADDVPTLAEWWQRAYSDPQYRQWVTETWDAAVRRAAVEGRDIAPIEYKVTCKNGEERVVEISGITLGEDFLATFFDLTERKQAEVALKTSEERFRTAAENLTDVVYDWDIKEKVDWYGDIDGIMGYPPGKFPRTIQGWVATIHLEDKDRVMTALEGHLKSEAPYVVQYRVGRRDGEWRWWSARGTALRNNRGEPYKMIGSISDITERKRAEEKLRLSEEQFRTMANSMPQLAWIAKADGYIFWYNQRWYEYTGMTPEQMEGWGWQSVHDPVVLPQVMHNWTGAIASGKPFEMEFPLRGADGRFHTFLTRVQPVRDDSGQIVQWFGTNTDVEQLKRAEDKLRESEAKLRTLVENMPQKILMKDRNYRWVLINENLARDFGFRPEEVVGKMDADLFTPDLAAKYHADDVRIMETGQIEELEEKYLHEGRETWVNTIKTPVRDNKGEIVGLLGVFWDITERKRAEEEIRKLNAELEQRVIERTAELTAANKELEAFSYSVSHDLRSPLRAIDGFSRIVLEDCAGQIGAEGRENLERVRAASQRMGQLIDDMLQLSRLTRGEMRLAPVDLSALARTLADGLKKAEPERRVEFVIEPNLVASADASLMQAVLENLLGNAWKFTGKQSGAKIELGRTTHEGVPAFFVRDNGVGFDMTYAHKLFGAFQRLHTTAEFPGTGIGLATVQRIIHRHGGRVWAESKPNQGATFYFTLPDQPKEP